MIHSFSLFSLSDLINRLNQDENPSMTVRDNMLVLFDISQNVKKENYRLREN